MKRTLAMAFAVALGVAGLVEATPPAAAASAPASVEQVRADALARLAAGDIETVRDHRRGGWSNRGRHNGWHNRGRHNGWNHGHRGNRYRGTDVWGSLTGGNTRRGHYSHRRHH